MELEIQVMDIWTGTLKSDDLIVQPLKHVDCCNEIHRQLTICFY